MNVGSKLFGCLVVLVGVTGLHLVLAHTTMYGADQPQMAKNFALGYFIVALAVFGYAYVRVLAPMQKFLAELKRVMSNKADLSRRIDTNLGEFTDLAEAHNRLMDGLHDLVRDLLHVADQVAAASNQLASSSNKISGSAKQQSRQATEVATAMEEMTATVNEVAQNATRVADQARSGSDLANEGARVVRQTIDSMETISGSVKTSAATVEELGKRSAEIGQIIGVISDIADLTNLLSLNAAIEAARAGEHGRGFAVVADEVRKLAEKTSKATGEVRETIGAIQTETEEAVKAMRAGTQDVQQGVVHAGKAEHSLADIVSSYGTVNDMVHQIATAAEEQSATSTEIAKHIESIASISQEVTDGISGIAHSAQQLADLSERMRSRVASLGVR
ncbi:MAG: methyl-accepting chemotaxis protein [Planctomycetaceae bacterium]|nr:methyl-accepting chemotaxis protein [Planctomycetaceae bacterium]